MKKMTKITAFFAFTLATGVAFGGEAAADKRVKELEKAIEDQGIYVETSKKGVKLSGYVDASYNYNFTGAPNAQNQAQAATAGNNAGALASNRNTALRANGDNDKQDFSVNAVKLALEKALPSENKLAAGFRVDLLMGEDYSNATEATTVTVQQAYAQFRAPIGNGLDVKFGKMVGLLGKEVDERPANMNYSYGLIYNTFGIPREVGVNFAYKVNDIIGVQLRLANSGGVDSTDSVFNDNASVAKTVSGLVTITAPGKNAVLNTGFLIAPEGEGALFNANSRNPQTTYIMGNVAAPAGVYAAGSADNVATYVYNLNGEWKPKFANDKLTLGFDYMHVWSDSTRGPGSYWRENAAWAGVNQVAKTPENSLEAFSVELFTKYQFTKVVSLAARASYLHDDDGSIVGDVGNGQSVVNPSTSVVYDGNLDVSRIHTNTDIYSLTWTLGFDIWENLLTRLEYRVDFLSSEQNYDVSGNNVFNLENYGRNLFGDRQGVQQTVGVNVAYSF